MVTLKDGSEVEDVRLDRLLEFDERSRDYPIMATVGERLPRSYTWRIKQDYLIDQYREGACVGLAVTNELQARPAEVDLGSKSAAEEFGRSAIYYEAQKIDPWEGGAYPGASPRYEGTSVLAGVKIAQKMGYFKEYRWGFGLRDLVLGVGYHGPAIVGMWWYDTNYNPDERGYIYPRGNRVGGHAILVRAVRIELLDDNKGPTWDNIDLDRSYFTIRNSWGVWGYKDSGDCFVSLRDMGTWLSQRGEAVFALKRTITV